MDVTAKTLEASAARFKAGSGNKILLVSPCVLVSENDTVKLKSRYQKSGSGWLALLATGITLVVILLVAQVLGYAAGPGYLFWYYIISRIRRAEIKLDLNHSLEIVTDDRKKGIAIKIPIDGNPAWIGIRAKDNYDQIKALLSGIPGVSIRSGAVKRWASFIVSVILILVMLFLIIAAITIPYLMDARRGMNENSTRVQLNALVSVITYYEAAEGTLPDKLEDLITKGYLSNDRNIKDAWGRTFFYQKSGDSFILKSLGKDGIESQDDIISPER